MIKKLDKTFYEVVCEWWKTYNWPVIPRQMLPKRSYIYILGDKPLCAGVLLKDDSSNFGLMDFIVGNPHAEKEERSFAINEIISHIEKEAKKAGVSCLTTISVTEKLTDRLVGLGYRKTNEPHKSFLVKTI